MPHQYKKIIAEVGGWEYTFDSLFEYHGALYFEFLRNYKQLIGWQYHPVRWDFWEFGYRNKPYEYTPDFVIIENDLTIVYIELKGRIQTYDLSRIRRANKHYGPLVFDLYMQYIPKKKPFDPKKKRKRTASQILAQAEYNIHCIRRVVNATELFKQAGIK